MEAEDPLSQLADIHLPTVVSFWPPAPGWWVLAALLLLGLALLARQQFLHWQQEQRLKRVLAELAQAWQKYQQDKQQPAQENKAGLTLLYAINSLLKRVALVQHGAAEVAPLSGVNWLNFLDNSSKNGSKDFTQGPGKVLGDGEYRPHFDGDAQALYQVARQWIVQQYQLKKSKPAANSPATNSSAGPSTGVST